MEPLMTDTRKSARRRKPEGPFFEEMLDQMLAQRASNDAEVYWVNRAQWPVEEATSATHACR